MLSTELLGYCLRAYVPAKRGFDTQKDFLISPLYTPDIFFKYYPPVRFFIGNFDPLHNDTVRLGVRMK
jgi:acetyl esterase/lipase